LDGRSQGKKSMTRIATWHVRKQNISKRQVYCRKPLPADT